MRLKTVARSDRLAIIAHGDRQEVILDIGVFDPALVRMKAQASNWFDAPRPLPVRSHCAPTNALPQRLPVFVKGYRLAGRKLHIDLKVILQVRPHTLAVGNNVDPMLLQMLGRSDPRQRLRSLGELIDEAAMITSRPARMTSMPARVSTSTPTARLPSITILRAKPRAMWTCRPPSPVSDRR